MALQKVPTTDLDPTLGRIIQLFQDNVEKELIPLQRAPLNGGILLKGVVLKTGQDNLVAHTLGRIPQIIITGLPSAQSQIWNPASTSIGGFAATNFLMNLRCSADCTISVWVN